MIRTLIADDEPLARELLRQMLAAHPDIEIVAESPGGGAALHDIRSLRPDLVLLDVQMPGMDGFEVLRALEGPLPYVVFVTAYDEYAVRAFEVHALDYLLKPFDEERLAAALSRVRERRNEREQAARTGRIIQLLETLRRRSALPQRIPVKRGDRTLLLPAASIDSVKAEGKFLHIHANGQRYTVREKLYQFASLLDPDRFLRISRSAIVNVGSIAEILPWSRGEYLVILRDGMRLASTRTYRDSLVSLLQPGGPDTLAGEPGPFPRGRD